MPRIVFLSLFALFFFFGWGLSPAVAAAGSLDEEEGTSVIGVVDMVVATVDGEPLTMADLRRYLKTKGDGVEELSIRSPALKQQVRDMVADALLTKEAKAAGVTVNNDEIQSYITEIKRQNNLDDSRFRQLLRSRGLSDEEYVEQVRNDIIRARVVSSRVRSKINILDQDVGDFLAKHPELKPKSGSVRLQQILFPIGTPEFSDEETVRDLAKKSRQEILDGKTFEEVGGQFYQDLGYVKAEDLKLGLQKAIRKLKPGEVSPVLQTDEGYMLLMLTAVDREDSSVDEKLKTEIQQELFQSKFKEQMEKFLNEELPKKYHVEFKI